MATGSHLTFTFLVATVACFGALVCCDDDPYDELIKVMTPSQVKIAEELAAPCTGETELIVNGSIISPSPIGCCTLNYTSIYVVNSYISGGNKVGGCMSDGSSLAGCSGGLYIPTSADFAADNAEPCPEGFYCPEGLMCKIACRDGAYCPAASAPVPQVAVDDLSTACAVQRDYDIALGFVSEDSGTGACCSGKVAYRHDNFPAVADQCTGSSRGSHCAQGYYCPTTGEREVCPAGSYCPKGAIQPRSCFMINCPEGTGYPTYKPLGAVIALCVVVIFAGSLSLFVAYFDSIHSASRNTYRTTNEARPAPAPKRLSRWRNSALMLMKIFKGTTKKQHEPHIRSEALERAKQPATKIKYENVTLEKNENVILDHVSGEFAAGKMTAVIGASGCGKTSLINVLSNQRSNLRLQAGSIRYNDTADLGKKSPCSIGVVPHSDVMYRTLTIRELLVYEGRLRLPKETPLAQIKQQVDDLLEGVELGHVADRLIGDPGPTSTISAGQRRRVSVLMELIADPLVLFLDEPTSGLDASNTFLLMNLLKVYCSVTGITIVSVIHQPRYEVFALFDNVAVIGTHGRQLYEGPTDEARKYFEDLGYIFPSHVNPADILVDIASGALAHPEHTVESLINRWQLKEVTENCLNSLPSLPDGLDRSLDDITATGFAEQATGGWADTGSPIHAWGSIVHLTGDDTTDDDTEGEEIELTDSHRHRGSGSLRKSSDPGRSTSPRRTSSPGRTRKSSPGRRRSSSTGRRRSSGGRRKSSGGRRKSSGGRRKSSAYDEIMDDADVLVRDAPPFFEQFWVILMRTFVLECRSQQSLLIDLAIIVIVSALVGFLQKSPAFVGPSQYARGALMFGIVVGLPCLRLFGRDRHVYIREIDRGLNTYALTAAGNLVHLPIVMVYCIVYAGVIYTFFSPVTAFGETLPIYLATGFCLSGMAYLVSVMFRDAYRTVAFVVILLLSLITSGMEPTLHQLDTYTVIGPVMYNLSYAKWMVESILYQEAGQLSEVMIDYYHPRFDDLFGYSNNDYAFPVLISMGLITRILGALYMEYFMRY